MKKKKVISKDVRIKKEIIKEIPKSTKRKFSPPAERTNGEYIKTMLAPLAESSNKPDFYLIVADLRQAFLRGTKSKYTEQYLAGAISQMEYVRLILSYTHEFTQADAEAVKDREIKCLTAIITKLRKQGYVITYANKKYILGRISTDAK